MFSNGCVETSVTAPARTTHLEYAFTVRFPSTHSQYAFTVRIGLNWVKCGAFQGRVHTRAHTHRHSALRIELIAGMSRTHPRSRQMSKSSSLPVWQPIRRQPAAHKCIDFFSRRPVFQATIGRALNLAAFSYVCSSKNEVVYLGGKFM